MDEDPLPCASHATTRLTSSPLFSPQYHALKSSSPPPLFSENDSLDAADVTVYESPRLKRKRAGTWWMVGPRAASNKKRQFARNFDSGVHMMSDDSEASAASSYTRSSFAFDANLDIRSDPPVPAHAEPEDEGIEYGRRTMTGHEVSFYNQIQEAVDANSTRFSFDQCGVEDNWLPHLGTLNQIVTVPPDASIEVPDEGQYRSMEPELHLNLAMNKLQRLEPTLFNLQYLTGLYLRNNSIEALPPQIAKLTNLQTLDVCYNSIRLLPCELLPLCAPNGSLERLSLAGNPLCEVGDFNTSTYATISKHLDGDLDVTEAFSVFAKSDKASPFPSDLLARLYRYIKGEWSDFQGHHRFAPRILDNMDLGTSLINTFLVSRTAAAYYDQSGRLMKHSPCLPMQERASHQPDNGPRTQPSLMIHTSLGAHNVPTKWFDPPARSKIPSLLAQSLATAYKFCEGQPGAVREELIEWMGGSDRIPSTVEASLARAERNLVDVFNPARACHCCGKDYFVARAEWIEGWFFDQQVVPVKVAVCSWGCVPDIIAKRPEPLKWL